MPLLFSPGLGNFCCPPSRPLCSDLYGNTGCGVFKRGEQNQHTQWKFLNFENWVNEEVSKMGHHFRKESDLKIDVIKKCAPELMFFNEKEIEKD